MGSCVVIEQIPCRVYQVVAQKESMVATLFQIRKSVKFLKEDTACWQNDLWTGNRMKWSLLDCTVLWATYIWLLSVYLDLVSLQDLLNFIMSSLSTILIILWTMYLNFCTFLYSIIDFLKGNWVFKSVIARLISSIKM